MTTYPGDYTLPAVIYAPGRSCPSAATPRPSLVDMTTGEATFTADADQQRAWSNLTVLADGKVFLNGGSEVQNELIGVSHSAEVRNPNTGTWTQGPYAQSPRLTLDLHPPARGGSADVAGAPLVQSPT